MSKLERVIRIIAILGILFAAWGLAINQVANLLDSGHETLLRQAEAECALYQAPHAVIGEDGEAYCYAIWQGSETMIPLEALRGWYDDIPETAPSS